MIEVSTIEIAGLNSALQALRLPFEKPPRSEVVSECKIEPNELPECRYIYDMHQYGTIAEADINLMQTLVKRGDEHAKVVRGIIAFAKITAPIYWWHEAECYRAGHERLCSESTMHTDCKGLQGDELVKAKSEIPMGKMLTKIDFFSYQCLRNIYKQRKGHRLPEWHQFRSWIESLPLADELITVGL